jgi:hypothetical protein
VNTQYVNRVTKHDATSLLLLLFLTLTGLQARAELSEPLDPAPNPDYFNLWEDSVTYGNGSSALTGDLTSTSDSIWLCGTENCSGTTDSGGYGYAQFSIDYTAPAGSGYIDPFQRLQHNEGECTGNCETQLAYNTDNDDLQRIGDAGGDGSVSAVDNQVKDTGAGGGNDNVTGDFNHAIAWETMFIDSEGYLTFMLDINEPGTTCGNSGPCDITSTLRLDELSFFIATTDQLSFYTPDVTGVSCVPDGFIDNMCDPTLAQGNFNSDPLIVSGEDQAFKFWDMDWDEAYAGLLMDNIGGTAGSGDFDVKVRVPVTMELQDFVNASSGEDLFVYLYNFMGEADELVASHGGVGVPGEWIQCNRGGNNCSPVADADLDTVCGVDRSKCTRTNQDTGGATSGFEEWVYVGTNDTPPDTDVPLPSTALLFAMGGLLLWRQRRKP